MKALKLSPSERQEFTQLWAAGGASGQAGAALGPALWRYLPSILLNDVEHTPLALFDLTADEALVDVVRAMGSLLGWLSLLRKPLIRTQTTQLRALAQQAFDTSLELVRDNPTSFGPHGPVLAGCNAASLLPLAWRSLLFGHYRSAARAAAVVRFWDWHEAGRIYPGAARLTVLLKEPLDATYNVIWAEVPAITILHDAMIAHRLRKLLGLAELCGTEAWSDQEVHIGASLDLDKGQILNMLRMIEENKWPPPEVERPVAEGDARDPALRNWLKQRDAAERYAGEVCSAALRVNMGLRLFEVPALATSAFGNHTLTELRAALATIGEELGVPPGLSRIGWAGLST